jgi:hypothetical protein
MATINILAFWQLDAVRIDVEVPAFYRNLPYSSLRESYDHPAEEYSKPLRDVVTTH